MDTVISAVNRTYPKADEKEIEFVFDYEKELETCMVMQDKRWLGEAVINVLDNAIKYSPDGSKIFIRLQKRNDLVRMEIEDQGIGIPQNEYHKIFQRFYRGSSRGHGKEWYRNRTFSIERNYRKTRRYNHGNLRQKRKKEARL